MFSKFAQPQPFSLLDQVGRDYNSDSSDNEKKFPRKALPLNKVSFSSIFENEDNEDLIQLKKRLKTMSKEEFSVFIGELAVEFPNTRFDLPPKTPQNTPYCSQQYTYELAASPSDLLAANRQFLIDLHNTEDIEEFSPIDTPLKLIHHA